MTTSKFSNYFMILFVSILFCTSSMLTAQTLSVVPQSSSMNIHGTSNLHDWDIKVTKITGELSMNSAKNINQLSIKIPVSSLKSGKGIMDGKTMDAFEVKKYPNIVFQLTEVLPTKTNDNDFDTTITGNLTLHGVTQKISFKSEVKISKTGEYQITGTHTIKMTDFKISPPTAFFGSMKTGDVVKIKFDIVLK